MSTDEVEPSRAVPSLKKRNRPVKINVSATLPMAPELVAEQILQVENWPSFRGYGPIPGIARAEFDPRTPDVVGSRIRVVNRDGSRHVEEIVDWRPGERIGLRMSEFSQPLANLASEFLETWRFRRTDDGTHATRSIEMHPRSLFAIPILWLLSFFLKAAIARHTRRIGPVGDAIGKA